MTLWLVTWLQLQADRRAVTALEYGLMGAAIVAVIAAGFKVLAPGVSTKFVAIGTGL